MSYRCDDCNKTCHHYRIRVVTETRTVDRGAHSTPRVEIAKESNFCADCADKNGFHDEAESFRKYEKDREERMMKAGAATTAPPSA